MKRNHVIALMVGVLIIGSFLAINYAVHEYARHLEAQKQEAWQRAQQKAAQQARQEAEEAEAERNRQAEEKARQIKEILGDEIGAQIGYQVQGVGELPSLYSQFIGYEFRNLRMFVNRNTGTLTIIFGCQFSLKSERPSRMLVRLFDKNGQYVTYFITTEYFATPAMYGVFSPTEIKSNNLLKLKQENNYLRYQINMRDAAYVKNGEFGVYVLR